MKYKTWLAALAVAGLAGCASLDKSAPADVAASPWAQQSQAAGAAWEHQTFPGKQPTRFQYARKDGRDALAVLASSSASMVRQKLRIEPAQLGNVRFSWLVPQLIEQADLASRDADDSPVRIVLAFDGDRSAFSPKDALLSELARTLTGEEMPYATLMYVWCNKRAPGSVVQSPRTSRIRKLVLESGADHLNRWMDYERNVAADFERAFGEKPGALIGVAVMTDTDNTRSTARAWYGPVQVMSSSKR